MCQKGNVCACCNQQVDELVQDHDHFNGLDRGLICQACNIRLTEYLQLNIDKYNKYLTLWAKRHEGAMLQDIVPDTVYQTLQGLNNPRLGSLMKSCNIVISLSEIPTWYTEEQKEYILAFI